MIEAAINDNPDVPGFVRTYNPPFPVGIASGMNALEFMQSAAGQRVLVPLMAFVDRTGMIRSQFTGMDSAFFDDDMDKHIRAEAEKLLNEGVPRATKSAAKSKSK